MIIVVLESSTIKTSRKHTIMASTRAMAVANEGDGDKSSGSQNPVGVSSNVHRRRLWAARRREAMGTQSTRTC